MGDPLQTLDIAVIGGGNGGYAAAADLSERGHRVRMWRRDREKIRRLARAGAITLRDAAGEREVGLHWIGDDLGEAVRDAQLILVPLPAFAQLELARALAPHLQHDQVLFMPPGSLGAYLMATEIETCRPGTRVVCAEAGTLPYLARKQGSATVTITARAVRLPTGAFPGASTESALAVIGTAFPAVEAVDDALSAALTNAGPIIHPPLVILNAAPLEHFETWDIHNEGTQASVRRVQDALDAERIALRTALGYGPPHYPLSDHYTSGGEPWMYGDAAHQQLVDSADWREHIDLADHRYVREDIACGLALMVSLGDWLGLDLPVARGLLALGRTITGATLPERTLTSLGLAGLTPRQMGELMRHGPDALSACGGRR